MGIELQEESDSRKELINRLTTKIEAGQATLYEIAKALGYPKESLQAPCNVLAHAVETLVTNYARLQKQVDEMEHKS